MAVCNGSARRRFGIVPDDPDASILVFHMESEEPDITILELDRAITHKEGVALIRDWIAQMEK